MNELTTIRLRTVTWLVLPVTVVIVVPWGITRLTHEAFTWQSSLRQWLGLWLMANGIGLAAWCVNLFNVEGRGTPLPLDPPTRLVITGPYRVVRNPMMLGMCVILAGEALMWASWWIGLYLAGLITTAHLFVVLWEEPHLRTRFGPPYHAYCKQVPRWVPRRPHRIANKR